MIIETLQQVKNTKKGENSITNKDNSGMHWQNILYIDRIFSNNISVKSIKISKTKK